MSFRKVLRDFSAGPEEPAAPRPKDFPSGFCYRASLAIMPAATLLFFSIALTGCRTHVALTGEHPPEMVGTWHLLIRSGCSEFGVISDTLILRADGTFDQHVVKKGGGRKDLTGQHWQYDAGKASDHGHIALDQRLEFFTPEISSAQAGDGAKTFEMLIVESTSEPVIVLHPDSDCIYSKIH
jgi:hypothetical protein